MKQKTTHIYRLLIALAIVICGHTGASAFDTSHYASESRLSQGKWVKISVPESGMYLITRRQLAEWGFNDPSKVNVYGYGGNRIPDKLTKDNYIDDLPVVQSVKTDRGIVFYGVGPMKWTKSGDKFRGERNIYTDYGYYFLSDNALEAEPALHAQGTSQVYDPETIFIDRLHYELDQYSPGEAGYLLVGENFKTQNNRKFTFNTPDIPADSDEVWMEATFVVKTSVSTDVEFSINGKKLETNPSDRLNAITNSGYLHGDYTTANHTFEHSAAQIDLNISVRNINTTQNVWLDYISINYPRNLALPAQGHLNFWSDASALALDTKGKNNVVVWDVTDPANITVLNTSAHGQSLEWGNDYSGLRSYTAWTPDASMPSPTFVANVAHQNLHGEAPVEMLILTLPEFTAQAQRVAELHSNGAKPLKVAVYNVEDVYNEFASGAADVSALRKCMKMFYDRGNAEGTILQYVLLMGRATYDNRHLTSQFQGANAYSTVPYYMGGLLKSQLSDNTAYGTDDFIAMLEDNSGGNLGYDNLSVAVGRMPVTSAAEAKSCVDKLYQYVNEAATGTWKNSFLFLADDGDNGIHVKQAEAMIANLESVPQQQNFITKVFVDAYDIVGGTCIGGRTEMFRMLDEGLVWWNYTGHANNHAWTSEGMLTYTDINNMYLKKLPILMAATCDFLRWDSNTISGGEIMYHERNGGIIAAISATRPVYISDNGLFTRAMGLAIAKRDESGQLPRLGDIYRTAKNNILTDKGEKGSNPNRLRFVLMGDPALILPTPSNIVHLESIGGEEVTPDSQVTLMALQQTQLEGTVRNPAGEVLEDFNGTVMVNLYDAERSITTKGERAENIQITYEQHGDKLFSGSGAVVNGHFTVSVAMPGEVTDNFRPALLNMYAYTPDKSTEAVGLNRDFYVYGYDESVPADTQAPTINTMVLNHDSFKDGDVVNESPMLIANVSDNIGINLSGAGVGHQMVLVLDDKRTYTNVSLYYTPAADGSPAGDICYPLEDLQPGKHHIVLKVWDTASNSTSQQIDFVVEEGVAPTIFDVYTDVNPASTEVKFFVKHNRPDAQMQVTISVYDLMGHELWTTVSNGPSDMFLSAPVTWDLCDASGRRLPRGIYLYRATISTDRGETYDSATRRLAVTAR